MAQGRGYCTWEKENGRYVCKAVHCPHWEKGNCKIGKVTLTCSNEECVFNVEWHCKSMDVFLDADGKCLGCRARE